MLEEYLYFSPHKEFEKFKTTATELKGTEWCDNKLSIDEFRTFRLDDFYTLWVVYLIFLTFASFYKAAQLLNHWIQKKLSRFIFFGVRGTANKQVSRNMAITFSLWFDFSSTFVSSWHILRRKRIIGKLRRIRAKLGFSRVSRVSERAASFEKNRLADLKSQNWAKPVQIKSSGKLASQSIKEITMNLFQFSNRTKPKSETSIGHERPSQFQFGQERFKSHYHNLVDYFYKKFTGESVEFFLSDSKEPFFLRDLPKETEIELGKKEVYYLGELELRKHFNGHDPLLSCLCPKKNGKKFRRIPKKFFKKASSFYKTRLLVALNNHFEFKEGTLQRSHSGNPQFRKKIQKIIGSKGPFLKVLDKFTTWFRKQIVENGQDQKGRRVKMDPSANYSKRRLNKEKKGEGDKKRLGRIRLELVNVSELNREIKPIGLKMMEKEHLKEIKGKTVVLSSDNQ